MISESHRAFWKIKLRCLWCIRGETDGRKLHGDLWRYASFELINIDNFEIYSPGQNAISLIYSIILFCNLQTASMNPHYVIRLTLLTCTLSTQTKYVFHIILFQLCQGCTSRRSIYSSLNQSIVLVRSHYSWMRRGGPILSLGEGNVLSSPAWNIFVRMMGDQMDFVPSMRWQDYSASIPPPGSLRS